MQDSSTKKRKQNFDDQIEARKKRKTEPQEQKVDIIRFEDFIKILATLKREYKSSNQSNDIHIIKYGNPITRKANILLELITEQLLPNYTIKPEYLLRKNKAFFSANEVSHGCLSYSCLSFILIHADSNQSNINTITSLIMYILEATPSILDSKDAFRLSNPHYNEGGDVSLFELITQFYNELPEFPEEVSTRFEHCFALYQTKYSDKKEETEEIQQTMGITEADIGRDHTFPQISTAIALHNELCKIKTDHYPNYLSIDHNNPDEFITNLADYYCEVFTKEIPLNKLKYINLFLNPNIYTYAQSKNHAHFSYLSAILLHSSSEMRLFVYSLLEQLFILMNNASNPRERNLLLNNPIIHQNRVHPSHSLMLYSTIFNYFLVIGSAPVPLTSQLEAYLRDYLNKKNHPEESTFFNALLENVSQLPQEEFHSHNYITQTNIYNNTKVISEDKNIATNKAFISLLSTLIQNSYGRFKISFTDKESLKRKANVITDILSNILIPDYKFLYRYILSHNKKLVSNTEGELYSIMSLILEFPTQENQNNIFTIINFTLLDYSKHLESRRLMAENLLIHKSLNRQNRYLFNSILQYCIDIRHFPENTKALLTPLLTEFTSAEHNKENAKIVENLLTKLNACTAQSREVTEAFERNHYSSSSSTTTTTTNNTDLEENDINDEYMLSSQILPDFDFADSSYFDLNSSSAINMNNTNNDQIPQITYTGKIEIDDFINEQPSQKAVGY